MSFQRMDQNPEILEQEVTAPVTEANSVDRAISREWPGVSPETQPEPVKFPGEDGGKSLVEMAERDLMAAVQLLAERAQYITGATGAAIALRDGDEMVCRASAGGSAPEVGARLQMNSGLSGESIQTRQLLRCNDAQTDGRVNRESCEALGIASVVVMPMLDFGEVIGVFELFSDRPYAFEDRDIVALERMGAMVRTALEQAEHGKSDVASHADEEPVLAEEKAPLEMAAPASASFTSESDVLAIASEGADRVSSIAQTDVTLTEHKDATPTLGEAEEPLEESLFLSVPERATAEQAPDAGDSHLENAETADSDLGELARDAAARTEAFKASLLASETSAEMQAPVASEQPGRIAFHMRVPRKSDTNLPVIPEASAENLNSDQRETPTVENAGPIQSATVADEVSPPIPPESEIASSKDEATAVAGEVRETAVSGSLPSASTSGFMTAAAPARGKLIDQAAPGSNSEDAILEETAASPATSPAASAPVEAPKPRVGIARPASPEGRAKMAVAQVRRCEACGFPVSEGRKLCLDCEKKAPKTTAAKPEATPESPAVVKAESAPVESTAPLGSAINNEAVVTASSSSPTTESPAVLEKKDSEPAPAKTECPAPSPAAEPPVPQFMISTPDPYESWIVSHMYTVAAIAVVVVGVAVYLLSR